MGSRRSTEVGAVQIGVLGPHGARRVCHFVHSVANGRAVAVPARAMPGLEDPFTFG